MPPEIAAGSREVRDHPGKARDVNSIYRHEARSTLQATATGDFSSMSTFFLGITPIGIAVKLVAATAIYSWAVTYSKWLIENRVCGGVQDTTWWTLDH